MHIDFEYAGRRLSDLGYIIGHVNSDAGMREVEIGSDIIFDTVKNNHSSIHSVTSSTYENVYTTTFEIIKNPCIQNVDDIYITPLEVREITKWLNRRDYYKFKLYNENFDVSDVCYYGSFNIKEIWFGDMVVGLTLIFTANTPFALADDIVLTLSVKANKKFIISGDSDDFTTIYPVVKIKCLSANGKDGLIIKNLTTGTEVKIKNCVQGETITIDGEYKIILTDDEIHNTTLPSDFNYEYFDILVDDSITENVYQSNIPCDITISYAPIRKVGVY